MNVETKKNHFGIIELALHMTRWCSLAIRNKHAYTTKNKTNYFFPSVITWCTTCAISISTYFLTLFFVLAFATFDTIRFSENYFSIPKLITFLKLLRSVPHISISSNFIFLRRWRSQGFVRRARLLRIRLYFFYFVFFRFPKRKECVMCTKEKKEGGFVTPYIVSMESKIEK